MPSNNEFFEYIPEDKGYVWYAKVALSCLTAFGLGWLLVNGARRIVRATQKLWLLRILIFMAPLCVYLVLNAASYYGYCDRVLADAFSFGTAMGILMKLNSPPSDKSTIKLIVYQIDGKAEIVWLDSINSTIGEARSKIAQALKITPVARVCIESGKGSILEDMSSPLMNQIGDAALSVDFFGFTTAQCYISVKSESEIAPTSTDNENRNAGSGINYIKSLIGLKNKVNYGQNLTLTCKNIKTDDDVRPLVVAPIEKFAAAAPAKNAVKDLSGLGSVPIRLEMWTEDQRLLSSMVSEAGVSEVDGGSHSSSPAKSRARSKLISNKGEPIKNGDMVVVECTGKFMSVTRGWWMAWSSAVPRRSGAFRIEVLDRPLSVPISHTLKEKVDALGEKMNMGKSSAHITNHMNMKQSIAQSLEADPILRAGDHFRLRSVKFPDYELGVTSVKLKDDFCYLGLRKVDSGGEKVKADEWCMPVRFSVRTGSVFK